MNSPRGAPADRIQAGEEALEALVDLGPEHELERTLRLTALNRVKFLLRSYLRTRLQKIEAHVMHILRHDELAGRLSEKEVAFASSYTTALDQLFKQGVLDRLPAEYQSLLRQLEGRAEEGDEEGKMDMVPEPDMDTYVFARALEDLGLVEGLETEPPGVQEGQVWLGLYRHWKPYVYDGNVELQ